VHDLGRDPPALATFEANEGRSLPSSIVLNVRDRLDLALPVIRAGSSRELGAFSAMTRSSSRLPADKTLAKDSVEVNQTFGSLGATRRSPRATAMVRAFISS
jgi:hypothetical protein